MAFWGVHLEPGKSYIHRCDKTRGKLRISRATLGTGSSTEMTGVQCSVGDKSPVLLCAFLPTKSVSCRLDLMFEEEDDVVFSVDGPRNVYLTGFYMGNSPYEDVIANKKVEVSGDRGTHIKRKYDTIVQAGEEKSSMVYEKSKDSSVPSTENKHENGGRSKKANEVMPEVEKTDNMDQEPAEDKLEEKQHNEDNLAEVNPLQVRTFTNGLVIEDLEYGEPESKIAYPGSKVSVHYIGKLKSNGHIFDSNVGGAPYRFKLGVGAVIKGLDVGINGMRVGDKRRLTVPPSMGYGAKGLAGKVPSEAWLVYEIELVKLR